MIRKRGDQNLVAVTPDGPTVAGGYVAGADNALLHPGQINTTALDQQPASYSESAVAALRETLAARALRGYEYLQIPSEDGFNVSQALGDRISSFNEDELEFLGEARSSTELAQRINQVGTTRQNYAAMAANPLTSVAASLFDADAVIGLGFGKAVGVARSARAVAAVSANGVVLGLASEGGTVSPVEVIGSSIGAALSAIPKVSRAAAAAEDTAAADARVADDAVPTAPPVEPTKSTAAELAATDSTIQIRAQQTIPDPDYVPPKPDTSFNTPYVEVTRGSAATLRTSTVNAVDAVLAHADDLSDGVKLLGKRLSQSLARDGDIPLVFRRETKSSRSNVRLHPDGSVRATMYAGADVGETLSAQVKGMTSYDKTILLHEAAHAKTVRTLNAWEQGAALPTEVAGAVRGINSVRQFVKAELDAGRLQLPASKAGAYNVRYGLANNDEFISQVFNSEDFRKALQSLQMPGNRNAFREIVTRIVQAFTGAAPTGSAFDELVDHFETLLQAPSVSAEDWVKAAARRDMPIVQSAPLQGAKSLQELADRAGKALNRNFALYDAIKSLGSKAATLANQLVVDATSDTASSATHYARTAHLAANVAQAHVDTAIKQAVVARGWNVLARLRHPQQYRAALQELNTQVYAKIADNHRIFQSGGKISPHSDPQVQRIVDAFAESRWAEDSLDRIKSAGVLGSELVERNPWYLPRRHSSKLIDDFLRKNPDVTEADIIGMYASQFMRMFADRGIEASTAKALGRSMLKNMQDRAAGVSGYRQHIAGMADDDIELAMRNAGIDEEQIQQFLYTVNRAGDDANTAKNLKRRAAFDMTADYMTASGKLIHPEMFVQKDVLGLMEGYSRSMAGRVGLARVGYTDLRGISKAVDEAAAEAADPQVARKLLDNTVNQLLGYPTGEDVPDILRSFSVASGAVQLANSGVFQLADTAMVIKQFGITKVLRALGSTAWGRDGLRLAQSNEYGSRLRDVLEARHVLSGRYRTVLTHLDDNTDIGNLGIAHQMVQQMGQGTRFVNGMEYVRRGQSKLTAGLIADSVDDAIRGNAEAVEALRRFGLNYDLLARLRAANAADPDLRAWPSSVRFEIETVAHNMADALVQENRLGEIPAWMQFSTLGKFILPYMNFVAGTWNKVLRRTYVQEGTKGVAMMFAYQLPLQVLASTVALAQSGKEITTGELTANVLTQMPLMSWMGYAVNMATQGPTNSIAALGLVDKAYSATASILSGDPDADQIIRAVPFLSIVPGMRIAAGAWAEED